VRARVRTAHKFPESRCANKSNQKGQLKGGGINIRLGGELGETLPSKETGRESASPRPDREKSRAGPKKPRESVKQRNGTE